MMEAYKILFDQIEWHTPQLIPAGASHAHKALAVTALVRLFLVEEVPYPTGEPV